MSAVDEKLDAAETGYGSIKDEPKTGGGLKLIVIGMLIGAFFGVLGTMALITPHSPLAQFQEDHGYSQACSNVKRSCACSLCCGLYQNLPEKLKICAQNCIYG